jgi:hypothetical protein
LGGHLLQGQAARQARIIRVRRVDVGVAIFEPDSLLAERGLVLQPIEYVGGVERLGEDPIRVDAHLLVVVDHAPGVLRLAAGEHLVDGFGLPSASLSSGVKSTPWESSSAMLSLCDMSVPPVLYRFVRKAATPP